MNECPASCRWLNRGIFLCAALPVLAGPWFFGAWEMWWFWPFAASIFAAAALLGVRMFRTEATPQRRQTPPSPQASPLEGEGQDERNPSPIQGNSQHGQTPSPLGGEGRGEGNCPATRCRAAWVIAAFVPFLVYAFIRLFQAEVFMSAERSFLLFLTPFLLGLAVACGMNAPQRRLLFLLLLANLLLLGLYGILNQRLADSARVLWQPAFPQYRTEHRATGSYFCPNHFAGILEIAFALALGILLSQERQRREKMFAALLGFVAVWGVFLSKSRGGGMTLVVVAALAVGIGFARQSARVRYLGRTAAGLSLCAILAALWFTKTDYMIRFKADFGWNRIGGQSLSQVVETTRRNLVRSSRGLMIAGALRAWRTRPWVGVGPGMHQHLWPHFAASPDGDRARGVWPSMPNYDFHSYEVHSDWVQLLEEYGLIGLALFLLGVTPGVVLLLRHARGTASPSANGGGHLHLALGALLAAAAMAFHSLGDFNLQMPATVWLLAAVAALALAPLLRPPGTGREAENVSCACA